MTRRAFLKAAAIVSLPGPWKRLRKRGGYPAVYGERW